MPNLKICSFNCEWMNDWFVSGSGPAAFRATFTKDGHTSNTDTTCKRTAAVITAIDPDMLAVQEGPSRQEELELFVSTYLKDGGGAPRYQCFLGDTGAAQKVGVLFKPQIGAQLALHADITGLIDPWLADVDGNEQLEDYEFTRSPLVVNLQAGAAIFQVIVMHTKSNFIQRGQAMWNDPAEKQNYIHQALRNRRRISAEGMRTRAYLDALLSGDAARRIIVLGDLNDGPGRDYFEDKYLTHNVTDLLIGSTFEPEWIFTHAQRDVVVAQRYTAVFDDYVPNPQPNKRMLLDHILLSPGFGGATGLRKVANSGAVNHAEFNAQVVNNGQHREDRPSDHRPVSVTLQY
ncbi:MAG: endonuclease/exonuclease/phosphatase family protein [Terriglobales bacterium]